MCVIREAKGSQHSEDEVSGHAAFSEGSVRILSRTVVLEMVLALAMRGDGKVMTADELGPWSEPRPGR
jgi:hypothetical protein